MRTEEEIRTELLKKFPSEKDYLEAIFEVLIDIRESLESQNRQDFGIIGFAKDEDK